MPVVTTESLAVHSLGVLVGAFLQVGKDADVEGQEKTIQWCQSEEGKKEEKKCTLTPK